MTATTAPRLPAPVPGLMVCGVGAAVAVAANRAVPTVSALLVAILLGALLANLVRLPAALTPGVAFAARHLLRAGIVLLGARLVLGDIWRLGPAVVAVVVAVVVLGITGCLALGRVLGVARSQALLVGCGFSICGAAAVAGIDDVVDADEQEVATAVALVVLFGTLMIPLAPLATRLVGFGPVAAGEFCGASIHEVAQVVAAGAALGPGALTVAVVVKLARVLMLAPVAVVLGWMTRRAHGDGVPAGARPPLVPGFVLGFLAMVTLASLHVLPAGALAVAGTLQTALLAAAMFALGLGVDVRSMARAGARPLLLGLGTTAWVAAVAMVGVLLANR